MERIGAALVVITALVYGGVGLWACVDPAAAVAPVGVGALTPGGLVELRAMYGGLQVGLGAFLIWTAVDAARLRFGLACSIASVGGLGTARLLSLAIHRPDETLLYVFAPIELGGAIAAAAVLWGMARRAP